MTQTVNPRMTPEHQKELAQIHAKDFNLKHPPGSVIWWRVTTLGPVYEVKVDKPAFVNILSGKADAEVFLVGIPGSVPVLRCHAPDEAKRNEMNPVSLTDPVVPLVVQGERLAMLARDELKGWRNTLLPRFGSRDHLTVAARLLREAADCFEAAYNAIGEG
jgi:hypothetical protein